MMEPGRLRRMFAGGDVVLGAHVRSQDACITEMLAALGFDVIWVENEHSNLDKYRTTMHIISAQGMDKAAIVRVPWNDPVLLKPILELGVDGVVLPMIKTAEEARRAVAACTYPPRGERGYGPIRANRYGLMPMAEYLAGADEQIFKIMQIEHVDGVNHIEEILDVQGVDAIIVGHNDLSASLGLLGQAACEENVRHIRRVFEACVKRGVPCGMSPPPDEESIRVYLDMGARFLFLGWDYDWVRLAAGGTLATAKKLTGGR